MRKVLACGFCVIGIIGCAGSAAAADGDVDTGFGLDGIALTGIDSANGPAIVLQPDGSILLCDQELEANSDSGVDFLVARFSADGSLDHSFGTGGRLTLDFGQGYDGCADIALQADGRIVLAGSTIAADGAHRFAIARLNSDGTPDGDFGTHGRVTLYNLGGGNFDRASSIAIQADGRIVVAGAADTPARDKNFVLVRLLDDGSLDASFDLDGVRPVPFITGDTYLSSLAEAVAIDAQGRIIAGGSAASPDFAGFAAVRLLADGNLDPAFGEGGLVAFDLDPGSAPAAADAYGLALQRDGKIVLAGRNESFILDPSLRNSDFALARLLPDGSLDANFGNDGRVLVPFDLIPRGRDQAAAVTEQPDGKLVAVGIAYSPGGLAAAIRVDARGELDAGFGDSGKRTYAFPQAANFRFTDLALRDDRIIVAGWANVPGVRSDAFATRLVYSRSDAVFADGFELDTARQPGVR